MPSPEFSAHFEQAMIAWTIAMGNRPCAIIRETSSEGRGVSDIYVDGDACPVREEVYRVADRVGLNVFVVSNGSRPILPPGRANVSMIVVSEGADAADDWIAERIGQGDICVTSDIPLASRCLAKGARAIAPTGKHWTTDNIGNALAGREMARHLRELGVAGGGPAPFSKADRSRFLSALDAAVQAALRQTGRAG
jgi:uncharacterized protein YaiI (UPF0178 family)